MSQYLKTKPPKVDDMFYHEELENLKASGLFRQMRIVESDQGSHITINGQPYLLLSGNNYLGLANHPFVRDAAIDAVRQYGVGSGASRLISGNMLLHEALEHRLARFKHTEAALIFSSGYMANLALLSCLIPPKGMLFLDRLCHASLIDGARLSGRDFRTYAHHDLEKLEGLLRQKSAGQPALIVTDGVFSMDGDIAPIPSLVSLAQRYGARILVDDAHATGILGRNGRGTLEHFGLETSGDEIIQMGTLGKAIGTFGAYVAGSRDLIQFLINKARTFIYTTAIPPAICASAIAAFDVIEKEPDRRAQLWENRRYLSRGLAELGFDTMNSKTPILPVNFQDQATAWEFSEALYRQGILIPAIRPPTVPKGTSRIRITVMATHTQSDLKRALEALAHTRQSVPGRRGRVKPTPITG